MQQLIVTCTKLKVILNISLICILILHRLGKYQKYLENSLNIIFKTYLAVVKPLLLLVVASFDVSQFFIIV